MLKGQKWSKQKKHKTDSWVDVNGGDTVLLEHIDPVNSAKRDFQYRMHVHTLVDWELSGTSAFHSKWQKRSRPPFFSAKAPSCSNYGAVGAGASDATAVKDAATARAGTIADGQFGCGGQRGEAGVRQEWGGGLKPATFRAAGAAPTKHRAARVRGTSIVCLLLLVLIIEAAVRGLGCPAETVECEAR